MDLFSVPSVTLWFNSLVFYWQGVTLQITWRPTQLKKQPCELTFSSTITSLRLGEGYKKGSRKDAKSQRKEGSRKSMSFVSIKQYSEDPVHPV
jgi:hypothetical protein